MLFSEQMARADWVTMKNDVKRAEDALNAAIASNNAIIADKDAQLADQAALIAKLQAQLEQYTNAAISRQSEEQD